MKFSYNTLSEFNSNNQDQRYFPEEPLKDSASRYSCYVAPQRRDVLSFSNSPLVVFELRNPSPS
jgi:hypothetical protein